MSMLDADRWVERSARNLAEAFAGMAARGGFRTVRRYSLWKRGGGQGSADRGQGMEKLS